MTSSFRNQPVQRKAIMEKYFLRKLPKVLLKLLIVRQFLNRNKLGRPRLTLSPWTHRQQALTQWGYYSIRFSPTNINPTGYFSDHNVLLQFSLDLYFCQLTGDI